MMENHTHGTGDRHCGGTISGSAALRLPAASDVSAVSKTMRRLAALYHPDKSGLSEQKVRVFAAHAQASGMILLTGTHDG